MISSFSSTTPPHSKEKMDSVINAALEEICSQLQDGITLEDLWPKLQPFLASTDLDLSHGVKRAIWANLLRVPTLRFESYSADDPCIQSFEDAEKLNLKIFPQQSLRDNFLGLYDSQSIQNAQMRVLQLLANARVNGITQSQLGKQLHIDGNNFHYVLRSLECQGLIVKQSAIERKKEISHDGESKNYPCVSTHLVYLRRYAKQLGTHQRLEITKEEQKLRSSEDADGNALRGETDVLVKDYTPLMKAICEKLAKANGKVLVVSDIKKDLGYCGSHSRHRAWREILRRLKADHTVEQFDAKVNGKIEACLRLLDPIPTDPENDDQNLNSGKICHAIDQFVELPIEHQVFDMINAAGSDGVTLKEICERLGIDLKKNHIRLINLCSRFGMKVLEEQCQKSKTIRIWTSTNFNLEPEIALICNPDKNIVLDQHASDANLSEFDTPTSMGNLDDSEKLEVVGTGVEGCHESSRNVESNFVERPTNLQEFSLDLRGNVSNSKHDLVCSTVVGDIFPSGALPSDVSKPFSTGSNQRYASFSFNVDSTRRANRILERLKDDKFILRPEINRWLNSFEKDKSTKLDRKTIDRILSKLQEKGQCKCITVHSPVLTEFSRTKDCVVVVHPSVSLSPELYEEIQDRVRSFNMHIRSRSTSHQKNDELIPVVEDIQKTQSHVVPDGRVSKAEAMRANGFVLAKMIRTKLLHTFLWDYLHSSASHIDALSSEKCVCELNNPHSSSKLFSLEAAIKEIPVELFLQVVGSTKKYEEMIEKCKMGLLLSNLPPEEYKCLMDTHATGRLSLVIDILRRLKLIRMVTDMQFGDGVRTPHASFTHMMELKPYIEEPHSNDAASLNFISLDLRPRIRHDFILSNRDAVDEYWQTLEYCYAAADPKAASYAFPGSVVHEVFRYRSWASSRLMTAEQRDQLFKRIKNDDLSKKISYRDCEKIAKELNLTLEQVLGAYYNKRRNENHVLEHNGSSSRRRKRISTELRPSKHGRTDAATDVGLHMEEHYNLPIHSDEHASHMQEFEDDDHYEIEGLHDNVNQCIISKMKQTRQRRFIWSDETDRQLVIQYVRHRAALGAKYHRIDWASLPDLPAPPSVCMRRMNLLRSNLIFRKAVNRLCNMLSERYAKLLEYSQNLLLITDDCRQFVRFSSSDTHNNVSSSVEIQKTSLKEEAWDDFENKSIKIALDEILRCKRVPKLDASSKKIQSHYEGWSDPNVNADGCESPENEEIASALPSEIVHSHDGKLHIQRSRRRRLDKKFTRFLNNRVNVGGEVYESLAVSNAVELFKLVFLSTSTGPQAPNLLADILRRYSEHDLFAAFNYLREKKILIGGNGSQPFELSQQFLHSVSKSPFPFNTGKRAVKFSSWLKEREKDLTEIGINLAEDLQCGDIFHLFALVSSGELSISPCLPDSGVGEAEDFRNVKRKSDVSEFSSADQAKKLKSLFGVEGEIISRREKGFPGIIVSACRATIPRADVLDLFKDNDNNGQTLEGNFQLNIDQSSDFLHPDHMPEIFNYHESVPMDENLFEPLWEAMEGYARRLFLVPCNQEQESYICAEVFRIIYAAIQKSGDQGLSMGEIAQVLNLPGTDVATLIVDVLQAFGQALKVNSYDSIRVVDALYRHKYFLTPMSGLHQVVEQPSSARTFEESDDTYKLYKSKEHDTTCAGILSERNIGVDNVHKVTILNLPHGDVDPQNKACDRIEGHVQEKTVSSRVNLEKETIKFSSTELHVPILPWVNGDGTINSIVYKGLRHRVVGIVMQNPGILEDDILQMMHCLNPQSCRTLLELMVLDKHLILRKMHQNRSDGLPSMLLDLIASKSSQSKLICREHFFANPASATLL